MAFDLNKLSQMAKSRSDEAKQKATDRKHNREWLRISQTSPWHCTTIFAQ